MYGSGYKATRERAGSNPASSIKCFIFFVSGFCSPPPSPPLLCSLRPWAAVRCDINTLASSYISVLYGVRKLKGFFSFQRDVRHPVVLVVELHDHVVVDCSFSYFCYEYIVIPVSLQSDTKRTVGHLQLLLVYLLR